MNKKLLSQTILYKKVRSRFTRNAALSILILVITAVSVAASEMPDPMELLKKASAGEAKSDVNNVDFPAAQVDIPEKPKLNSELVRTVSAYLIRDFNEYLPEFGGAQNSVPSEKLKKDLFQLRITTPVSKKENNSKDELESLLEQIRSMEFVEPEKETSQDTANLEQSKPEEQAVIENKSKEKPAAAELKEKPSVNLLSERTLEIIEQLCANPEQVKNPFELAEILFLGGFAKQAGIFYKQQYSLINAGEEATSYDKAWIMFQIANCTRVEKPDEAVDMYKKMITEFPDCPWTDIAKARVNLLELLMREKPEELMANKTQNQ